MSLTLHPAVFRHSQTKDGHHAYAFFPANRAPCSDIDAARTFKVQATVTLGDDGTLYGLEFHGHKMPPMFRAEG